MNINKYFDENVVSIGFDTEAGHVSSGVMSVGEYTFGTSQKERMVVVHGELVVQLPNTQEWLSFPAGTEFNVDANVEFNVKVATPTAYLCYYS
ncbi:pyrimidine/purine nucleoside phosphorylase [Opacimonas viscosa]|uniref:Pyrimidine/purine nucleoside phosphorylase n=1 Tax=Opacimonas viscosa TaxID=2961944 RepID=A0AA42BLC3_9ALTE|nr:pyrimidine/purine nucleoside phosphorylase [Opacimonas viscosa]MCP3428693.1 pyrimidine/purine nucleoside phosphorylase [Opacimonas viscosa]